MIESCAMNYCQDGLQVNFATETQQYTYVPIYGHYELQPNIVNGRSYFKMGSYGLWWDGNGLWWIGLDGNNKGQSFGIAYYERDVFCPDQLSDLNWNFLAGDGNSFYSAEGHLGITCKCIYFP